MTKPKRTIGWMGMARGHRAKPLEWLGEKIIFLVSLTAILMIFLIFLFIGREAVPIIFGQINSAPSQSTIPVAQMDKLSLHAVDQTVEGANRIQDMLTQSAMQQPQRGRIQ